MTVFAPASENAPWIPWSERDGYLWTVAIMSTRSTLLVTSQFRLQVQCSSFSFTISLLSWIHCILLLLSLVYIFDSYSSSLCSAPLSPAATLCFSLLLLYLLLFLLLPFLQGSFLFLVFYIFWSNSKYMMGEQDKIMCTSSGPSRSSSCHPCA